MSTLPKSERLHSYGAIRRLFTDGKSGFVYPFRYMFYTEEAPQSEVAVLFSTPKKFHKRANKRNVLRRRMREAYRLNKQILLSSSDPRMMQVALIYSSKEVIDYKTIENAICKILDEVSKLC